MKKMRFLLMFLFTMVSPFCFAANHTDKLLSLLGIKPEQAKQEDISSLLGTPTKIEQDKKQDVWYYNATDGSYIVYWNNRTSRLEKVSFSAENIAKTNWDNRNSRFLKSGETNLSDVIKALGTPKDMTMRGVNQELHYSYQNNVLNLFF